MLSRDVPPNHSVDRKLRGHFAGMKFMAHPLEHLCADPLFPRWLMRLRLPSSPCEMCETRAYQSNHVSIFYDSKNGMIVLQVERCT